MGQIIVECETGKVSDGYHTFDELYEHRCLLFCTLLTVAEFQAPTGFDFTTWKSRKHSDGSSFDGWFVAGMDMPISGTVTYHLPERMWELIPEVPALEKAPEWDGHTSKDVIERLTTWLRNDD